MTLDEVTRYSEPGRFLFPVTAPESVNFEKRDVILILGLMLFMIGLIPFMAPVYAIAIVAAMGIGIKFYVARRKSMVERDVGRGICVDCGAAIHGKSCPNCDPEDR